MGSMPNLHELCQDRRRTNAEKERDAVRERAQHLEFISRDYRNNRLKDQLPTLFQVKQSQFNWILSRIQGKRQWLCQAQMSFFRAQNTSSENWI